MRAVSREQGLSDVRYPQDGDEIETRYKNKWKIKVRLAGRGGNDPVACIGDASLPEYLRVACFLASIVAAHLDVIELGVVLIGTWI
jgi:hypothetical protein